MPTATMQKKRLLSRFSAAHFRKIGTNSSGHVPLDAVSPDAFSSRIIAMLLASTWAIVGRGIASDMPVAGPKFAPPASSTPVG